MSLKIISICIPEDKIISEIQDFTPEENYLMLKIGGECLIEGRKRAIALSQNEIYEKIKQESRIEIEKLEMDIVIEKRSSQRLEEMAKDMYENQIGRLESRVKQLITEVEAYQDKINIYEKKNESEIKTKIEIEIERTKEKYATELEKHKLKYDLLLNEKDIQNQLNRNAFDSALQILNRQKSMKEKGTEGEDELYEIVSRTFRDFNGFQIENMAKVSHKGDFHLYFEDFKILVDSKKYTNNVGKKEIDKIESDLLNNENMNYAWLISLNTDISGWNRHSIMFKWVMSDVGPKCIFFINQLLENKNPENILRILWSMCTEFHRLTKKAEIKVNHIEEGLIKRYRERDFLICNHIKNMQERSNEMRKSLVVSSNVLKQINNEIVELLELVSDEIVSNKHKKNEKIEEWFSTTTEECENKDEKISSSDIWSIFKRDNKEYIKEKGITVEIFKDTIKSFIEASKYIERSKNGIFDLIGYKIINKIKVENQDTSSDNIVFTFDANPKHKKIIKKIINNTDQDICNKVLELYKDESHNIITISEIVSIKPYEVITMLVRNKVISCRVDARGHDIYKNTDNYKSKIEAK